MFVLNSWYYLFGVLASTYFVDQFIVPDSIAPLTVPVPSPSIKVPTSGTSAASKKQPSPFSFDSSDDDDSDFWPEVVGVKKPSRRKDSDHSPDSVDSMMVWSNSSNKEDNKSVALKRKLTNKALSDTHQKRIKKNSYHTANKRLQLDDIVWASVGERVDLKLPSGRRSTAKERLYGQIISSVDNNQYMVAFSDGKERQMTSRMLKKATPQEVASYHEGIESLMGKKDDGRPHHCHNEVNSANVGNIFT